MQMMKLLFMLGVLATPAAVDAAEANPIRKVVTMLQMMQNKVKAEGEKEQELFDTGQE